MRIAIVFVLGWTVTAAPLAAQPKIQLGKSLDEWCRLAKESPEKKLRVVSVKILEIRYGPREDGVLQTLFAVLQKDKDADVRAEVVQSLSRMDPVEAKNAAEAISDALKHDKSEEVREAAAKALAGSYNAVAKEYVLILADALKDTSPGVRAAAAEALRNLGKNAELALDKLVAHARDAKADRYSRQHALQAVLNLALDQPSTATLLAGIAKEKDAPTSLRVAALEALGKLSNGLDEAISTLAATLKDTDVELRRAAAHSLGKHGSRAKPAWDLVKLALKDDADNTVRFHLIRVVAEQVGVDKEPLKILAEQAQKDVHVENRLAAIGELQALGGTALDAIPVLEKIAEDDLRLAVREAAKAAILKIKDKDK
jgi:HEAT repeat protein